MATEKHDDVLALSDKLVSDFKVDSEGKPDVNKDVYTKTLEGNLSVELGEEFSNHNKLFYPAAMHAASVVAVEAMKKDKGLDQVTFEIPMIGKDHFDVTINRSRTYRNPQDETTPVVKWGQVEAQLVTQAAKTNRGEMSAMRDKISSMALEALCK